MDASTELEEIMNKETWTQDDCLCLREAVSGLRDPIRKLRESVAALAAANPSPAGAPAIKLGIANFILCRFGEAVELLADGTDNKERRFYQALCFKHLRRYDEALEALNYAEDRGWDQRQVTLEKAEVQCLVGDVESAARTIERFAKSSRENPDWHYIKGMIAEMQGDYDFAVESYQTARELLPGHPAATFRLAYHYDLHGDEEEAMELYLECVTAPGAESPDAGSPRIGPYPVYANALLNLAVLYEDAGRYDDAAMCLRRILACNPDHARARLFLKDVLASKTMVFDEDEAKRLARQSDLLAIPVTDFELSVRARNCLKKMNIRTLGDLLHVTEVELLGYKNFGETSLAEIKTMLSLKNLRIGQMREDVTELSFEAHSETGPSVGNEGVLATPISQINISIRVRKVLDKLNIKTLGELTGKSEPELMACQNFGQTSLNEVLERLAEYGLNLREPG